MDTATPERIQLHLVLPYKFEPGEDPHPYLPGLEAYRTAHEIGAEEKKAKRYALAPVLAGVSEFSPQRCDVHIYRTVGDGSRAVLDQLDNL